MSTSRSEIIDLIIEVIIAVGKINGTATKTDFSRLQSMDDFAIRAEFRSLFTDAVTLHRILEDFSYSPEKIKMLVVAYHPNSQPD